MFVRVRHERRALSRRARIAGAILVGIAPVGLACSGGTPSPSPAPGPTNNQGGPRPHAIHVFASGPDGSKVQFNFGPGTDLHFGITNAGLAVGSMDSASDGGALAWAGTPVDAAPTIDNPETDPWGTAWTLVWRAAGQCGAFSNSYVLPWYGSFDPGEGPSWFAYPSQTVAHDCATRLYTEQNLVCVADKLSAIADAVGTVVWPALNATNTLPPFTYDPSSPALPHSQGTALASAEWNIPPQSDADRFIVRDLAIHALAMIPTLDAFTDTKFPSSMPQTVTCTGAWAWLANPGNTAGSPNGCIDPTISTVMFGQVPSAQSSTGSTTYTTPFFPPSTAPICDGTNNNAPTIAQSALDVEAQILRSSGRLLHDLIRRDVYSDLAAAAQEAAQALDPVKGNTNAWGQPDQVNGTSYGTISHAARVLMGRWEIGDGANFGNVADPQCEGVTALTILPKAFGADRSARYLDRPIRTLGEQTAVQLVERSGIVLPSSALPGTTNAGASTAAPALKQVLLDQLLLEEKLQNNLPSAPPAAGLTAVVAGIADADVVFAFQRALRTWRLLTNSDESTSPNIQADGSVVSPDGGALVAGIAAGPAAPSVSALQGIVVQGGLSRSHLSTDPMARAGGMTEASQCSDSDGYWDEWGSDRGATLFGGVLGLETPPVAALPRGVFQDAFHIGQALERRLNLLRIAAATVPLPGPNSSASDAIDVAKGGIAELRTWAGSTIVHAWPTGFGGTVTGLTVRVGGMSYASDFGTSSTLLPPVQKAFGFVYGPPWMAECAAHVRRDCPSDFDKNYVQPASGVSDVTAQYAATGVLNDVFELTVPLTGPLAAVNVVAPAQATQSESHLYMIRLQEPASSTGQGRVLGTIPLRGSWSRLPPPAPPLPSFAPATVGFVDAPMQRELVHDAIDLGHWVGAKPPALGDPSAAATSGYCVDGVPRDLFVPLDNELVSGAATYEDSWQAYLALAQQAATTADTLGKELIANDLEISKNQQAAEEKLADICGDFGALSTATVGTDGTITAGPEDTTTQNCLNEPMTDVVFLGKLPSTIPAPSDPSYTAKIKEAINCGGTAGGATPPSAIQLCQKASLTADALGIGVPPDAGAPSQTPPAGGAAPAPSKCDDILDTVASSILTGFDAQKYIDDLSDPSQTADAFQGAASQLKMVVDVHDNWVVTYGTNGPPKDANSPKEGTPRKIMDSKDPAYWPACIDFAQCSLVGSGPSAVNDTTAKMAMGWSTVFRNCPNGNAKDAQLGVCDPDGSSNAVAELNMIRWRVTQAMWMIAATSGEIPANMFTQPIPAEFTDSCIPGAGCVAPYNPAGQALSYAGRPSGATTNDCSDQAGPCKWMDTSDPVTTQGDSNLVGPIFPVDPAFRTFAPDVGYEMPYWYRTAYSQAQAPFVSHIIAKNESVVADQCAGTLMGGGSAPQNPFGPGQLECPKSPQAVKIPLSSIVNRAASLEGFRCTNIFGEESTGFPPAADPSAGQPWWVTVTDAKLGIDRNAVISQAGASDWSYPAILPQSNPWLTIVGDALAGTLGFPGPYGNLGGSLPPTYAPGVLPSAIMSLTSGWGGTWTGWDRSGSNVTLGVIGTTGGTSGENHAWLPGWGPTVAPRDWPPAARALSFAGYGTGPNGTCGSIALLVQASALACTPNSVTVDLNTLTLNSMPTIQSLQDIPVLEAWLGLASTGIDNAVGKFYVQSVPTRAVNDIKNGTVGSGSLGGTKGQAILALEQQLQGFPSAWTSIASDLASISNAIAIADGAIVAANLNEKTADGSLALATIQTQGAMTAAVDNFLVTAASAAGQAFGSYGASLAVIPVAAIAMADATATGQRELGALQSMASTAGQTDQNQVGQALAALNATTVPLWADVQKQIDNLRGTVAQIDATGQTILQSQNQAAYQAAVGTGADFVNIPGQGEVPIPVDTVLRRQSSATLRRYQAALTNAKALAYMARRAIEQRIGVTLDQLTQQIGPVEAPASWADDICSLQGVNYSSLSTAVPSTSADGGAIDGGGIGGAADLQAISQFANGWVGDYVAKLQNFVTYYNVQYPSHQGEDTAILSLRYDLLGPTQACTVKSPNLLVNSDDLSQFSGAGWQKTPCDPTSPKCLAVLGGDTLAAPLDGPWGAQGIGADPDAGGAAPAAGITWLTDVPQPRP